MPSILVDATNVAAALSLLIFPGLLVLLMLPAQALPRHIAPTAAFILSPGVVAAELAIAAMAGVPFEAFAQAAAWVNVTLVAVLWLYRRPGLTLAIPITWLLIACTFVVSLAVLLEATPLRREYGWHNMMQLAAIQAIYGLPRVPEEIGLAGTILNYGWLGWAQIAAIAKLTDTAPTLLFFPLNAAHFICLFILLCEAARALLGASRPTSMVLLALGVGLALLGAGLPDMIGALLNQARWPQGDLRIAPMFSKYLNMDVMVFGLSAAALALYAMIRAAQSRDVGAAWMMAIAALAACLTYPLFLPSFAAIAAAFLTFACLASWLPDWQFARYRKSDLMAISAVWLVFLGLGAMYVAYTSQDVVTSPVALRPMSGLVAQTKKLVWVFGIIDALLLVVLYRAWREKSGVLLLLASISCGLQLAFLLIMLPASVEYKFLFVALLAATPPIAATLSAWAGASLPRGAVMASAFAAALVASLVILPRWHQPSLALAEPLDERSAQPHPSQGWSDSWLHAVREHTPADAVLLTGAGLRPSAVFTARALYVCADPASADGSRAMATARVGYSLSCEEELRLVKGYSPETIAQRRALLDRSLAEHISPSGAKALIGTLAAMGRPIVLHSTTASGLRGWLEANQIGRAIFVSGTETVWLIDRDGFSARPAFVKAEP